MAIIPHHNFPQDFSSRTKLHIITNHRFFFFGFMSITQQNSRLQSTIISNRFGIYKTPSTTSQMINR